VSTGVDLQAPAGSPTPPPDTGGTAVAPLQVGGPLQHHLGMLMATIDISIMLIALPDIFRGIGIDPLQPGNSFYLLWMILSFMVVTSVLVVSLGRLGDMYGRVKMYNSASRCTRSSRSSSASPGCRDRRRHLPDRDADLPGVGAAFLIANSSAILTDAFPRTNGHGLASTRWPASAAPSSAWSSRPARSIQWRLIFLVSVPSACSAPSGPTTS